MSKVELEIKLNTKLDKAGFKQQIKTVETEVSDIDINIKVDADDAANAVADVMDAYAELEAAMSEIIDVEINTKEGEEALDRLNKAIREVEGANFDVDGLAAEFSKTKKEVDELNNKQRQALAQMKLTGQEGSESYKKLQTEIDDTEKKIREMEEAMGDLGDVPEPESFINFMAKFEALGNIGGALEGFADKGLELQKAMREVQAATGATNEEMAKLKENALDVFKAGVGESVAEAVKTLGYGKRILGQFLDDTEIKKFTVAAQGIANVFDKDVNEVIAGSRTFIAQFGLDGERSANLVALAMQNGASKMDDVLDTLDEYSQLAVKAGYSAEQMVGLMTLGMEKGVRDTDKLLDSVKELQIRLNAGDTSKALADISAPIARQIAGIVRLGEQGVKSVNEVTQESASLIKSAYDSGEITAAVRDQLTVALSGTMAEDIGGEMWTDIFSADIDEAAIRAQAEKAGAAIGGAVGSLSFVDEVQRQFEALAAAAGETLASTAQIAGGSLTWISQMAPGLSLIQQNIGHVKTLAVGLLTKLVPSLGAAATAQGGLNLAMLANPYVAIIAGVAALATGIYFLADALHQSAEEKLADAKAQDELINAQIEAKNKEIELVKGKQQLIDQYKKSGKEAEKNKELMLDLAQAYPEAIDGNKKYQENLVTLESAAAKSRGELEKLNGDLTKLQQQKLDVKLQVALLNVEVARDKIRDTLSPSFWENLLTKGIAQIQSDVFTEPFIASIENAKNSEELQAAGLKFQMAIFKNPNYDKKAKLAAKQQVDDYVKARQEALDTAEQNVAPEYDLLIKQGEQAGEAVAYLADQYNISEEEVKKLVAAQKESGKEANSTATNAEKLKKNLEDAKKNAQALSKAFTDAKTNSESLVTSYGNELAGLQLALKQGVITQEEHKERSKAILQLYLEQRKVKEDLEQIEANIAKKYETKEQRAARYDRERDAQLKTLEVSKEQADTEREIAIIKRGTEETVYDEINAQEAALSLLKDKLQVLQSSKAVTREQRQALQQQIGEINSEIKKEEKNLEKLTIQSELDKDQLARELASAKLEYTMSKIEFDISLGIADESALFPLYQQQLSALAEERERINNKIDGADEISKQNLLIRLQEISKEELDIEKSNHDSKAALIDRAFEKEKSALERQTEILQKYADKQKELWEGIFTSVEDASVTAIGLATDKKLDALDKQQERELDFFTGTEDQKEALTKSYEDRKAAIQEEAEKRKMAAQEQVAGARFALESQQLLQSMALQQQSIELELEAAKKKDDKAAVQRLQQQLEDTEKVIAEKGDKVRQAFVLMSEGVDDVIANMFAGNSEAMKQNMRDVLNNLVGYIKQLVTAWVWEMVLTSPFYKTLAAAAGPAAPLVEAGGAALLSQLLNGIMSPFLNAIAAFPTGAIFDQPTLAIVGDGARLGGENREILLRDDQLQQVLDMVVEKNNKVMASYFGGLLNALTQQRIVGKIVGSDMLLLMARAQDDEDRRNV